MLCERGIRTFETVTRNTLDLNAIALLRQLSHLPLMVDPSHGTGDAQLVPPLAKAALAAGADGLLIEVHESPAEAWSDADQTLDLDAFARLIRECRPLAKLWSVRCDPGRTLAIPRGPPTPSSPSDGPAGSGKSTTARALAHRLGLLYVDSGACTAP